MKTNSCFLSVVYICMLAPQFCLGTTQNRVLQSLHPQMISRHATHTFDLFFYFILKWMIFQFLRWWV